ncbi:ThiL Thiamine monophosphate kinase [Burkholderiaceae bacterium]
MGEFELIERYFKRPPQRAQVGVGDDCAIWMPTPGQALAISSDMLVEGRHFLSTVDPAALGHKALAVNLSDLAACGATPCAFTLALALPQADDAWLRGFAQGLWALADTHGCELIGGDTTRGPLTIAITVWGELPPGQALLRSSAQVGDDIYISGVVGQARMALEVFRGQLHLPIDAFERARARMERPTPRVALGQALRGVAHAAIDLSDGLLGDLDHILKASGVGADIDTRWLLHASDGDTAWPAHCPDLAALPWVQALACGLTGGDDYELLFTAAPEHRAAVWAAAQASATPVSRVGRITPAGLRVLDPQGQAIDVSRLTSFDHFA